MNNPRPPDDLPDSEVMFVRRIVIVAAFLGLAAAIWFLSNVLLLVFAGVLVASGARPALRRRTGGAGKICHEA